MSTEREDRPGSDDEIPRQGFWASMPKRTLSRVLISLALLAGILYLRQRTGAIAGCMSNAFLMPPPGQPVGPRVRARILPPPPAPSEKSPR